jgi:PAS domain S-box-containing protein
VTHWNRGAEVLYGWRAEEVVDRPLSGLTVGPADETLAALIMTTVRAEGLWEGRFDARRRDGTTFPAFVRDTLVRDGRGAPAGLVGISVDISAQVAVENQLRSARDSLAAVTDSMGEGLLTNDCRGHVRYINPAGERLLGEAAALVGAVLPGLGACAGTIERIERAAFARTDGTHLPVAYTSAPYKAPDGTRGAVVTRARRRPGGGLRAGPARTVIQPDRRSR